MLRAGFRAPRPSPGYHLRLPACFWWILLLLVVVLILIVPRMAHGAGDNALMNWPLFHRTMWAVPDIVAWLCGIAGVMFIARGYGKLREIDGAPTKAMIRSARILIMTGLTFLAFFAYALYLLHTTDLLDPDWRSPMATPQPTVTRAVQPLPLQ